MTDYNIKAETFIRLAKCALQPGEQHTKFDQTLRAVRIEQNGGVAIAVASFSKILVGECLGECGEDGAVNITIDAGLLALAEAEAEQDGSIEINQVPGWTVARTIVTEKMYPLNAEIAGDYPDWRALVPSEMPKKNNGAFCFDGNLIHRMGLSSPSGSFVLPSFVDKDQPVLVRDKLDPNWFGLFLVTDPVKKQDFKPALIPEWLLS